MSRTPAPGIPASFNHARMIFSHVEIEPGAPLTLAADPWSFFQAWLHERIGRCRGDKRTCARRALYFVQIAEEFYKASRVAELPSQATLAYYGMLHLVKAFLSLRGVDFELKLEHHGLALGTTGSNTIQVQGRKKKANQVFQLFATELGVPVPGKDVLSLQEICRHIPEIHEMAFTLGHADGSKRTMLPVSISLFFNESQEKIYSELSYGMKHCTRVPISSFSSAERSKYLKEGVEVAGRMVHRCKRSKSFTWHNIARIYKNICSEYRKLGIVSLLTTKGYRYYCDLANPRYHHLSYSLALLFYLGIVVRYRPNETRGLLESSLRPLMTEALALIPDQMLYQLVGLSIGCLCVKPYAKV